MVELWPTTALTQILRLMIAPAWKRLSSININYFSVVAVRDNYMAQTAYKWNDQTETRIELEHAAGTHSSASTVDVERKKNGNGDPLVRKIDGNSSQPIIICIYCLLSPHRTSEQYLFGWFRWNTRRILSLLNIPLHIQRCPTYIDK